MLLCCCLREEANVYVFNTHAYSENGTEILRCLFVPHKIFSTVCLYSLFNADEFAKSFILISLDFACLLSSWAFSLINTTSWARSDSTMLNKLFRCFLNNCINFLECRDSLLAYRYGRGNLQRVRWIVWIDANELALLWKRKLVKINIRMRLHVQNCACMKKVLCVRARACAFAFMMFARVS